MVTRRELSQDILEEVIDRIVAAVSPKRIVLFGSAARDQMGPSSDLDLLVIMPSGTHRRKTAQELHRCLKGLGVAKDIVVVTESDVAEQADNPATVLFPALRQGRELYRAA